MFSRSAVLSLFLISVGGQFCLAADPTTRTVHVGLLMPGMPNAVFDAFVEGMNSRGYVDGKNLVIEQRWAKGRFEDLPRLAKELVDLKVDIIVTATIDAARAAQQATKTIPIIIASSADPVASGLVTSLARPGGNVTGLTVMLEELGAKRLELLKEVAPKTRRVAILSNLIIESLRKPVEAVAPRLKLHVDFITVSKPADLDVALDRIARGRYDGILVFEDPIIWTSQLQITTFATAHKLPGVYGGVKFVRSGGLISYGPDLLEMFRRAADYADKVLKGANPAELPIEQPTKFELVVNLKTAKALGITIPESVLLRADEVIK